jgi:hypothetical protein
VGKKLLHITVGRLAFVADFGTRNFNLKTKFDMENNTSINHENGNDANRLLAAGADLIGKFYEMLNLDDSVMHRFKIKHVRTETTPAIDHSDGSHSPSKTHVLVSAEGSGWFRLYGGKTDRVVEE